MGELQEKVKEKEVENDDEIYLLKKEIKTLTELSQQSSDKNVGKEENLELLKKAKRREKEDMKHMKKLEEKVARYKLIIKDSKKRKLEEEDLKSNISFKIPKKSSVEKADEVSLSELVSKAREWTEKNLKKSESGIAERLPKESESYSSLNDIPLPAPVLSLRKSPNMELEEASNQRFYHQRSPPRQWNPPPRRGERSRGYSNRESLRPAQTFDSSHQHQQQEQGYHSQPVPAYDPSSPGLSYPTNIGRDPRRREASLDQEEMYQRGEQGQGYLAKVYGILNRAGHSTSAWQQSDRWQSSMPRYRPY